MLNHKGTEDIRTNRLLLRKYRLSDMEDMFRNYAHDERVTKYLSWKASQCTKTSIVLKMNLER